MLHTWKRAVLFSSALAVIMLAIGAPIQADDDDDNGPDTIVERDKDAVKVTHIIRSKARPSGGTSTPDPGYSLTGWKWTAAIPYVVYTDSVAAAGLDVTLTTSGLQDSFVTWSAVHTNVPATSWAPAAGVPSTFAKSRNDKNEIAWKNVGGKRTIAVTYTWSVGGVAKEFDMAFNTAFPWAIGKVAGKMDVQNIATHEAGHVFGLGHSTLSSDLTMYPYADYAEIIRRTLEQGDIDGIKAVYPLPAP